MSQNVSPSSSNQKCREHSWFLFLLTTLRPSAGPIDLVSKIHLPAILYCLPLFNWAAKELLKYKFNYFSPPLWNYNFSKKSKLHVMTMTYKALHDLFPFLSLWLPFCISSWSCCLIGFLITVVLCFITTVLFGHAIPCLECASLHFSYPFKLLVAIYLVLSLISQFVINFHCLKLVKFYPDWREASKRHGLWH